MAVHWSLAASDTRGVAYFPKRLEAVVEGSLLRCILAASHTILIQQVSRFDRFTGHHRQHMRSMHTALCVAKPVHFVAPQPWLWLRPLGAYHGTRAM